MILREIPPVVCKKDGCQGWGNVSPEPFGSFSNVFILAITCDTCKRRTQSGVMSRDPVELSNNDKAVSIAIKKWRDTAGDYNYNDTRSMLNLKES